MQGCLVGEGQDGGGVGEQVADAVGRVAGIDRQVHAARLHHRQQRHHQIGGAFHHHRDQRLRPHPTSDQQPRQPVRPPVQLPIRQLHTLRHHRGGLRRTGDLGLEQLRQRGPRHLPRGGVPLRQDEAALGRIEDLNVVHRCLRLVGDAFQDPQEPPGEVLDRHPVEQVARERHPTPQPRRRTLTAEHLPQGEVQVELSRHRAGRFSRARTPGRSRTA